MPQSAALEAGWGDVFCDISSGGLHSTREVDGAGLATQELVSGRAGGVLATRTCGARTPFSKQVQEWLDAGYGSCVLTRPVCRRIVEESLQFFDGERYTLDEWTVAANHVHVVLCPAAEIELDRVVSSCLRFTARRINAELGRRGRLWQHEPYDHIVRNETELAGIRGYIRRHGAGRSRRATRFP
ncbi:MAG: transposase [Lentisphaeria bacterium]|nr:transposase [Lentisphaeria bacterium]